MEEVGQLDLIDLAYLALKEAEEVAEAYYLTFVEVDYYKDRVVLHYFVGVAAADY